MNNYEKLLTKFEAFNDILETKKIHYTIYLFGAGLGIYHLKEDYRMSNDLDYTSRYTITDREILEELDMFEIHDMGGIMQVPEISDFKIIDTIEYTYLTVCIPSIEDFAISKLLSCRPKDYNDLISYPILDLCNIEVLRELLAEYVQYLHDADNPNYNFKVFDTILELRKLK